ncbi:MAG: hypothetical protein ACREQR_16400 [Candidatus Binataceae bacterium]
MRIFVRSVAVVATTAFLAFVAVPFALSATTNRYGGPIYTGEPALAVTASLVAAGGGPGNFSVAKALTSMIGPELAGAEVAKLEKQYGKKDFALWAKSFDFAIENSLKIATADGIKLPAPTLSGKELASALVDAGTDSESKTWWSGLIFDKALSHKIHDQVMDNIDKNAELGTVGDYKLHQITNQAFYDLAQALGHKDVRLASVH